MSAGRLQRVRHWRGILWDYVVWQAATQTVVTVAGLLFVRFLPVQEYALYTLAMAGVTILGIVSDIGMANSLPHFGREAVARGRVFEHYVLAVLRFRRVLLIISSPFFVAGFLVIAVHGVSGWVQPLLLGVAACGVAWFQARTQIGLLVCRIRGRYRQAYRAEFVEAISRLILVVGLVTVSRLGAVLAVTINALGSALSAHALGVVWRWPRTDAPASRDTARHIRQGIVRYVAPFLPTNLHHIFQDQFILWLSFALGRTRNVAELGALGRLGVLMNLPAGLLLAIVFPRLAAVVDLRLYRRRCLQWGTIFAGVATVFVVVVHALARPLLAILGAHYGGLERELELVAVTAGLGLLRTFCGAINVARGWVRWQPVGLVVLVAIQVGLIAVLPLDTTAALLRFGAANCSAGILVQFAINVIGFRQVRS